MATKKPVAKSSKSAPKAAPVKKAAAPAKKAAPAKPVAKKATPAKTAPAKAAPPKAAKAPEVKKAAKPAVASPKKTPAPAKPAAKTPAPAKPAAKTPVKKAAPLPVKKTAPVPQPAAVKKQDTKPPIKTETVAKKKVEEKATKPAAPKKAEAEKPVKVVIPKTSTNVVAKYEPEFTKSVLDQPLNEPQGPTMRYSDSDLNEFRELINKKLDAARKELTYLQGLITRKDEMGGDNDDARYMTMEDGSMSMEREQLSQMASRQIQFIDHLDKAIMRIENKTYGICRVTGKLIDKARLRAVPHATLSMEAKLGLVKG